MKLKHLCVELLVRPVDFVDAVKLRRVLVVVAAVVAAAAAAVERGRHFKKPDLRASLRITLSFGADIFCLRASNWRLER